MNSFDRPQSDSSNFEEMEIYRNELAAIREIEMIESETDHQFDLQQDGWIFNIWASKYHANTGAPKDAFSVAPSPLRGATERACLDAPSNITDSPIFDFFW